MATSTQTHVYVLNDGMAVSNDHPANPSEPVSQPLPFKPYYSKYVGTYVQPPSPPLIWDFAT
jgi:hypothetical protein